MAGFGPFDAQPANAAGRDLVEGRRAHGAESDHHDIVDAGPARFSPANPPALAEAGRRGGDQKRR